MFFHRIALVIVAALAVAPSAQAAPGVTSPGPINRIASLYAGRPATVRCYDEAAFAKLKWAPAAAWIDDSGPWHIRMQGTYCDSLLALMGDPRIADPDSYSDKLRGAGLGLLVHEAYHLRDGGDRNEGRVQCRTLRHYRGAVMLFAANPSRELADRLYRLEWANQLVMRKLMPEYWSSTCAYPTP